MTQPSGRVLSLPSRYRTYLRSSPIICALDALAFLLRVFITPCLLPVSLHQVLEAVLRERYKDTEDASEGLQSLEKQTWLRWVFFIVGTLGPSIKLMAMQGVPWTKVWGGMFLFTFLVTEAAALFNRRSRTPSVYSSLPGIRYSSAQVVRQFESVELWLYYAGLIAHCTVLIWAFFSIWAFRCLTYSNDMFYKPVLMLLNIWAFLSASISFYIPFLWLLVGIYGLASLQHEYYTRGYGRKWSERFYISFMVVLYLALMSVICIVIALTLMDFGMDTAFFPISVCSMLGFVWAVKKLCSLSPRVGETLLVSSGQESSPAVDASAVYALAFCVANIIVCMFWYWLRYNPEGTVNPSWTGIFG
jgi:hypothetical protein